MGSGASSLKSDVNSKKSKYNVSNDDKTITSPTNKNKNNVVIDKSPFDDCQSPFQDEDSFQDDNSSPSKSTIASATKLKRMAFGQQSYMDQQRDYDDTLHKLDFNKTVVVDWIEPTTIESPTKYKPIPNTPDSKKVQDGFFVESTSLSSQHSLNPNNNITPPPVRKPPPPTIRPMTNTPPNAAAAHSKASNNINPTQISVQAPQFIRSPPTNNITQTLSLNNKSHSELNTHITAGLNSGSKLPPTGLNINNTTTPMVSNIAPTLSTTIVTKHNNPGGLISRPFPKENPFSKDSPKENIIHSVTSSENLRRYSEHHLMEDDDIDMYADFSSSIIAPTHSIPQNVYIPPLDLSTANQFDANSYNNNTNILSGTQLNHIDSGRQNIIPTKPSVPKNSSLQNVNNNLLNQNTNLVSNKATPNRPSIVAPIPINIQHSSQIPISLIAAIGPDSMIPTNPLHNSIGINIQTSTSIGINNNINGAHTISGLKVSQANKLPVIGSAPVVKETKNVKRNRAQIPTTLTHAKPTTGDWLNKRYIVNNYILLEILGTGSYGEVRLCKDRTTDKLFAIKIFSKDFLKKKKTGKSDETFFEDIKREIAIMKKLLHPNVLRLFEVLDDPKVNKMYLVLEYMKMGDLINVLKKRTEEANANPNNNNNSARNTGRHSGRVGDTGSNDVISSNNSESFTPLTDLELWNIFRQVVSGIRYLHYQNVVHGDIKPQNLLLGEDGLVKIADFGISQMLSASGQKLADAAGTPAFMSPELCQGKSFSGQLADIWAIGATMFMLRFGHPPFIAKSIINLYNKICNDPLIFPAAIDPGLKNLLENLLVKDPSKRYTLQQIIMHPWFRHPPAVKPIIKKDLIVNNTSTLPAIHNHLNNQTNNANSNTSSQIYHIIEMEELSKTALSTSSICFKPPATYEAEEQAAMEISIKIDSHDEVFMSIGGIKRSKSTTRSGSDGKINEEEEDDDDDDEGEEGIVAVESTNHALHISNLDTKDMMDTNWGADVFEMVDDGDNSDDDGDSDSVDDESVASDSAANVIKDKKDNKNKLGSDNSLKAREEMSIEEQERRAKRFMNKITKKSESKMINSESSSPICLLNKSSNSKSLENIPDDLQQLVNKDNNNNNNNNNNIVYSSSATTPQTTSNNSKVVKLPFRAKSNKKERDSSISIKSTKSGGEYYEEEMEDFSSMDDFNKMMDTLAMQPLQIETTLIDDSTQSSLTPKNISRLLPIDGFSAELTNLNNNIAAAFYSEKGSRNSQEDRCVLLTNVSEMKILEEFRIAEFTLKQLNNFSIACIFDGHNGWRCSQYLSQHLPTMLVMHDKFLIDKQCDIAIAEVCVNIDRKVCDLLLEEEDGSGSTGVIAIYDGRRHVLTVASVGDSLCVLSRSGQAVVMNKMHRLDCEEEKQRVKRAGGTIINNRVNGVLAISRAFGDTQFKPEKKTKSSSSLSSSSKTNDLLNESKEGLVISYPEICSEKITKGTQFAIIASDGLWDVMKPQQAIDYVINQLYQSKDLEYVTKSLTNEAIKRGSIDNVTVLIMSFHYKLTHSEK